MKKKASLKTIVQQTRKAVWVRIAEELGIETGNKTVAVLVGNIQNSMEGWHIPDTMSAKCISVLERMGYSVAPDEDEVPLFNPSATIKPMRVTEIDGNHETVRVCTDKEAEFYSIYLKLPDGTEKWISDHDSRSIAMERLIKLELRGELDEKIAAFALEDELDARADKSSVMSMIHHTCSAADFFRTVSLPKEALPLYLKVLDDCKKAPCEIYDLPIMLANVGKSYQEIGEFTLASQYISEAIDTANFKLVDESGLVDSEDLLAWRKCLGDVYRSEVKLLIMKYANSRTVNCLSQIKKHLGWEDSTEVKLAFLDLLAEDALERKVTPSQIIYHPSLSVGSYRRSL